MSHKAASGTQHALRAGDYACVVSSVGASLRLLTHDGRDLVVPFRADEVRPSFRGAILAPWPNRVVNGRYTFLGAVHQLALTEPARSHALHGLVLWADFEVAQESESQVRMATTIEPQAGYPWRLRVETAYSLGETGLRQSVRATNLSGRPAPWGTGPHPYLTAGTGTVDEWTLSLPAARVLEVTPDRLCPTMLVAVDAVDPDRFDFRTPRVLGAVEIDHAYTALQRDPDGMVTVRLTSPSGQGVAITWDTACPWVQIHTADLPAGPADPGHRAGLAVEPMTCAPDAFNASIYDHDANLVVLEPGVTTEASWTISRIDPGLPKGTESSPTAASTPRSIPGTPRQRLRRPGQDQGPHTG